MNFRNVRQTHGKSKISGVVISYNRADVITTCLRALSFVDELLLFDKSSTDGTADLARELVDRVTVIPWSPVVEDTRAMAIEACTHDWIVCLDDDECLSVEAARYIEKEVEAPRALVYLLPQRHYILGEHDERAYYWPERQPRFFHRSAVSFKKTVHGGTLYDAGQAYPVPSEDGVCIHHLSHRDVSQWIEKTNRYTSQPDRARVRTRGDDLRQFAHDRIDEYTSAAKAAGNGSYPQAVGVLRALYDIVDRLKIWEEARDFSGTEAFEHVCAQLESKYRQCLPERARAGVRVDKVFVDDALDARCEQTASICPTQMESDHDSLACLKDSMGSTQTAFESVQSDALSSSLLQESDKSFWHGYLDFYRQHLPAVIEGSIVEFGVFHGNSIRWLMERYPTASITGVDILPLQPNWPSAPRISYCQVDQSSEQQVAELFRSIHKPFLIIDDGSHIPDHQARCLRIGLKHLEAGGYYVLEDIHTAHPTHELHQEESARLGLGLDARNRPTVLSLLLCLEQLLRLGTAFGPTHLHQFAAREFMSREDLTHIAQRIRRIDFYRRSTLPTRCYACSSAAFDYTSYRCACGVDLMKFADSMTAVIEVR